MPRTHLETLLRRSLLFLALSAVTGCLLRSAGLIEHAPGIPPPLVLGTFEDDYGIQYSISEQEWHQHPNASYRIVRWRVDAQYLIAQNDAANPSDAGLWTRIDWIGLEDMAPYEWAFCMSVYDASTAEKAERTDIAQRDRPRTGCNGYPFSRMRRRSNEKP